MASFRESGSRVARRTVVPVGAGALLLALLVMVAAAAPREARGQLAAPAGAQRPAAATDAGDAEARTDAALAVTTVPRRRRADWWTPLASAVVPGAGQAVLGQDRWVAYAAVELLAWAQYRADLREAGDERLVYRQLADRVARALYGGTQRPGDFEYYEHMEKYVESGVFDMVPGGALDPETDETTFNGATWLLARQTYWEDPSRPPTDQESYLRALAFYEQRAIRPEYRWSWRNAQLEQDLFRRAIDRSNSAFRRSAQDLAVVLANHVLSTVDAYVTVRVRRGTRRDEQLRLEAQLPLPRRRPG